MKSATVKAALIGGIFVIAAAVIYIFPWIDGKLHPYSLEIKPKVFILERNDSTTVLSSVLSISYTGTKKIMINVKSLNLLNTKIDQRYFQIDINRNYNLPGDTIIIDTSSVVLPNNTFPINEYFEGIDNISVTYKYAGGKNSKNIVFGKPKYYYSLGRRIDSTKISPNTEINAGDTLGYKLYRFVFKNQKCSLAVWPYSSGIQIRESKDKIFINYVLPTNSSGLIPSNMEYEINTLMPIVLIPPSLEKYVELQENYTYFMILEERSKGKKVIQKFDINININNLYDVLLY